MQPAALPAPDEPGTWDDLKQPNTRTTKTATHSPPPDYRAPGEQVNPVTHALSQPPRAANPRSEPTFTRPRSLRDECLRSRVHCLGIVDSDPLVTRARLVLQSGFVI